MIGILLAAALLPQAWTANWIAHPTATSTEYGVFHFRKTVDFEQRPAAFRADVSADNRYRLFVNGTFVCSGPAQGDLPNWRYETVDLAPYLRPGKNVLSAVVWNGGEFRPMAQITHRTGFVLRGPGVDTDASWKVLHDLAYTPNAYRDNDERMGFQYYVAGAMEKVDGNRYPWGWEQPNFDDSSWQKAAIIDPAAPAGVESHQRWQLVPRPVPLQFERLERPQTDVRGREIPAHAHQTVLIDHGRLTTGYPVLRVSGGAGSRIQVGYAEALFDAQGHKGDRAQLAGKKFKGYYDEFRPDGAPGREYRPLWVRSFRFVQLDIETGDQPLKLDDFHSYFTAYPGERKAVFESDSAMLGKIWDTAWRTMELSGQDVFVSDLYWERIQYVGDTKLHALSWLAATGDDRLVRQAIQQFDQSRAPFGLTQSRYPAALEQYTPLYSLIWVSMVHDYWMLRGDDAFVKSFLPGITQVLDWYDRQVNEEGLVPLLFQLDFVDSDYFPHWEAVAKGQGSKSMTIHSLFYLYGLDRAAALFEHFGRTCEAHRYREQAARLRRTVYERCYDRQRGLFADTPDHKLFSQQANILAILTDAVPAAEQSKLLDRMLADKSLLGPQLYFRFFLGRAMKKTGRGDLYFQNLAPWEAMIRNGMTTFGETDVEPRSECHPWSSTPAYELLATVAGIEPDSPGFRTVRIQPNLGPLQRVHARMPHPAGQVEMWLERGGKARIQLPAGVTGTFVWQGHEYPVSGSIDLKLP